VTAGMSSTTDVVVIGGGAIGAATAYELAQCGATVTVLERDRGPDGCSFGNAGLICPSHAEALASLESIRSGLAWLGRRDSPLYLRPRLPLVPWLARFAAASLPWRSAAATSELRALAAASLARHAQLAAAGLETGFARRGILSVYESERGLARARARRADVLDAAGARELEPSVSPAIAGAQFHAGEAHCDPGAFVRALLDASGADVRSGVEVLRLRRSNGRIAALETTEGRLRAGTVVLAAGTWTRELARQVGVHVPLEPAKGYHVEIKAPSLRSQVPVYMEEAKVTATPINGRLRLGGTLELSGLDFAVDPVRVDAIAAAAARTLRLPADARTVAVWRGLRPCTPDGLPVIGTADGIDNMVLATGHAMLGITLAPVTGEIVASLIGGEPPRHDIEPFRASRFARLRDRLRGSA
jgi:D-amino-acid dehydrogenase